MLAQRCISQSSTEIVDTLCSTTGLSLTYCAANPVGGNTLGNNIFASDSGVAASAVILYCGLAARDYLQIPAAQHHYPPVAA